MFTQPPICDPAALGRLALPLHLQGKAIIDPATDALDLIPIPQHRINEPAIATCAAAAQCLHRGTVGFVAQIGLRLCFPFVMSINDRPEIREIFGRFIVDEVRLTYTVSSGAGTKARELIISNQEAPAGLL